MLCLGDCNGSIVIWGCYIVMVVVESRYILGMWKVGIGFAPPTLK